MPNTAANSVDTQQLETAFQAFSEVSGELSAAYQALEARVEVLTRELAASRRARQQELSERQRVADRLSLILDVLPAAVVLIDARERVDQFNPAAETLFPELRWGRRWPEVFAETGAVKVSVDEWRLSDGRRVSLSRGPLQGGRGEILVLMDVTHNRHLQQQLEHLERLGAMGEMAAQLAHQIRTPIAAALLYTEHLGRTDLSAEQRLRFSQRLKSRLQFTENQVGDMLAFARGAHFAPEPVDLGGLIRRVAEAAETSLDAVHGSLEVNDTIQGIALVTGNPDALSGALMNLIENAVAHGGEGVSMQLDLLPVDEGYCIRFRDDGPGIPEAHREKIFEPFFTTRSDGTGLGLAVVQNVVHAHGGAIRLMDTEGQGAGFVICLPCRGDAAVESDSGESV